MSCNINPILLMMLLSLSIYCSFSNKLCNEFILVYDSLRGLSKLLNALIMSIIESINVSKLFDVFSYISSYLLIRSANEKDIVVPNNDSILTDPYLSASPPNINFINAAILFINFSIIGNDVSSLLTIVERFFIDSDSTISDTDSDIDTIVSVTDEM